MRNVFLFTFDSNRSAVRDALEYGPCRVTTHLLEEGRFSCPITAPPDLAILEPAPTATIAPLLTAMQRHPVVGRVQSLVVLDTRWLPLAARMPCSDFVARSAPPAEILARVSRLIGLSTDGRQSSVAVGSLVVDVDGFEARIDGAPLQLTPQEFALLRHLVQNPGRAWNRDVLLDRVWGHRYGGGTRTVDIHVRRLRAKLGSPHADPLQTVRGVGYKWSPI